MKRLRQLRKRVDDKDLVDKEGFDEALKTRTAEMRADYDGRIAALETRATEAEKKATEAQQRYDAAIIDRAIQDAALANGVLPEAISDALFRARRFGWQLNDKGEVIAKAPNGDIRYGADGATPLKPKDWVTGTLRQEAKHLFKGHAGGGATGSNSDKTDPGYNPWKKETWNLTEQSKIFRADPDRARNLARQAGATLPTAAAASGT
jgi:hypothetical protein